MAFLLSGLLSGNSERSKLNQVPYLVHNIRPNDAHDVMQTRTMQIRGTFGLEREMIGRKQLILLNETVWLLSGDNELQFS